MSLLNKSVGRKKLNSAARTVFKPITKVRLNRTYNPPSYLKGLLAKSEDEISIDPSFKE